MNEYGNYIENFVEGKEAPEPAYAFTMSGISAGTPQFSFSEATMSGSTLNITMTCKLPAPVSYLNVTTRLASDNNE